MTELIEREEAAPAVALNYDYEQLEPAQRAPAMHAACQVKLAAAVTASAVLTIGRELSEVKELLPHGQWGDWLAAEFDWTDRTARNYLAVFEAFGSDRKHVSVLENASLGAVFVLARRSTPAEIRVQALTLLAKGQRLTRKLVIEMLAVPGEVPLPKKAKRKRAAAAQELDLHLNSIMGSFDAVAGVDPGEVAAAVAPILRDRYRDQLRVIARWLDDCADQLEEAGNAQQEAA